MLYFFIIMPGIGHQLVQDFMVTAFALVFLSYLLYFSFPALQPCHLGPFFLRVQDNGRPECLLCVRRQLLEYPPKGQMWIELHPYSLSDSRGCVGLCLLLSDACLSVAPRL